MKKRTILSLLVAFASFALISAQDLNEVLDTYFETIGQEKVLEKESMMASGKALIMGMENPFKTINKRPDKIRVEVDIQGAKMVTGYDGTGVWMINPMTGSSDVIDVTGVEATGTIESADMDGLLWNYEEKGHQVVLEGKEEVDGSEAFVLKMTKKDGNTQYFYIDAENYVVTKMKQKLEVQGTEMEAETYFSNFQDVDGMIMPFTIEQRYQGQTALTIVMDKVEMNVDVDDSVFAKPE